MTLSNSYRAVNQVTSTPSLAASSSKLELPKMLFATETDSSLIMQNLKLRTTLAKYDVAKSVVRSLRPPKLGRRWAEYQGSHNWEGLLDPLHDTLRSEILRYGQFVEATYRAFDFDPLSSTYATCPFSKNVLLRRAGLVRSGYQITRNLHATCGVETPGWVERLPSWMSVRSSWIGYVAVCQDKEEIARIGRRDVVIALRGTATCLEWLENLRATLTDLPKHPGPDGCRPKVESGFFSLYTSSSRSRTSTWPSLQDMIKEEVARLIQLYGDERLSLTITGHSLGAALAILSAHDISTTFPHAPMVTVFSFGGPRVGNESFRSQLDQAGTKILRIVNSDDLVTKVPGFVSEDDDVSNRYNVHVASMPTWIQNRVKGSQWGYVDVGQELKLSSKESPYLKSSNFATCHDLKTYLHLVDGCVSSTRPFRATKGMLSTSFTN